VEPPCPYFGECGGCQYQHLEYGEQLALKHKQVADLFERIGGFSGDVVRPVVPCPQPYGYRNRIMIRSQWNKHKQGLNIGFLRAQDRLVVDIEECKIAEPALSEQIRKVRENPPPKGGIKVTLRLLPDDWNVPRDSFFQNNFHMLPALSNIVRACLREGGSKYLVDAYCGVGYFAIELADLVEAFVGVEIDAPAIKAARQNAARRGVTNGEFMLGSTEELLPGLLRRFESNPQHLIRENSDTSESEGGATTVILDPPRRGCAPESLDQLLALRPAQIIHVSCHPATLARDLKKLCADGAYELRRVTPLDMFPQTQHIECVADLRRRDDADRAGADDSSAGPTM
jgi:tRNA/tmRNA/rRNA uracil-C5-methylase (TrmA/RlmC/RlmD family)